MKKSFFEFDVHVHGRPIREYLHRGKFWVEGRDGSEFQLVLRNNTPGRVLAVPSVDGLSVMDGKPASYHSSGYVVQPKSTLKIPGWRLDLVQVAKFVFAHKPDAYAAQTGDPANVGVLACAWFLEQAPHITYNYNWPAYSGPAQIYWIHSPSTTGAAVPDSWSIGSISGDVVQTSGTEVNANANANGKISYTTTNTVSADTVTYSQAPSPDPVVCQDLGVGFGPASGSQVVLTEFKPSSVTPVDVLEVRYDSREGLRARGIDTMQRAYTEPQAFPGQFCVPPMGYSGKRR